MENVYILPTIFLTTVIPIFSLQLSRSRQRRPVLRDRADAQRKSGVFRKNKRCLNPVESAPAEKYGNDTKCRQRGFCASEWRLSVKKY